MSDEGLVLPTKRRARGYFARTRGTDLTRTSFMLILGTRLGERVMRADLGSQIPDLLFEPNDAVLQQSARAFTEEAIKSQQSRASLVSSSFNVSRDALQMTLVYRENRETEFVGEERLDMAFTRR